MTTGSDWSAVSDLGNIRPIAAGRAQLWLLPLTEPSWLQTDLAEVLDPNEQDRAVRFAFARDRTRFIVSHGLLRTLLGAVLGLAPGDVRLTQNRGEKPIILDASGLEFSLSHSGDWALVGLAMVELGVDVEVVRPIANRPEIARRNFARAEVAALAALPEGYAEDGFFACWTRKEAYLKALGVGLAGPLDGFEVEVDPRAPAALRAIGGSSEAVGSWSTWGGQPAPGVWAAAAAHSPNIVFDLFRLDPPGLLEP